MYSPQEAEGIPGFGFSNPSTANRPLPFLVYPLSLVLLLFLVSLFSFVFLFLLVIS